MYVIYAKVAFFRFGHLTILDRLYEGIPGTFSSPRILIMMGAIRVPIGVMNGILSSPNIAVVRSVGISFVLYGFMVVVYLNANGSRRPGTGRTRGGGPWFFRWCSSFGAPVFGACGKVVSCFRTTFCLFIDGE